jgi:hypothetical protein
MQKKPIVKILLPILILAFLLPGFVKVGHTQNAHPTTISWSVLEKILDERTFKSREELFQLLSILYSQQKGTLLRLEKDTLSRFRDKITTLFPLEDCVAIELRDTRVIFEFTKAQDVFIPNTLHQASLRLPARLVLRIEDNEPAPEPAGPFGWEKDPENRSISFFVEEGYAQVHFSFILKLFGSRLRDADGTVLIYRINDRKQISRLHLIEMTTLSGDKMKITTVPKESGKAETLWIDILHPDFPGEHDIGISEKTISFLGMEVELLPDHMIRIGDEAPQKNEEAWHWFSTNIELFRKFAKTGALTTRIDYTRDLGYHFEERKMMMQMGFQGSDKVN